MAFRSACCIYCRPIVAAGPERYTILPSLGRDQKWPWQDFRFVDVSINVSSIMDAVEKVFREDGGIMSVARHDGLYPITGRLSSVGSAMIRSVRVPAITGRFAPGQGIAAFLC
jgi:hypothetical protein